MLQLSTDLRNVRRFLYFLCIYDRLSSLITSSHVQCSKGQLFPLFKLQMPFFFYSVWGCQQQQLWPSWDTVHSAAGSGARCRNTETEQKRWEARQKKGETKKMQWTSGGLGQRKYRKWTASVPEDLFISWSFLEQFLQSPTAQRRTWRPPAEGS